jgi:hypothetical protein
VSTPLFPTPWMYGRRKLTRVEIAVYAVLVATLVVVFFRYLMDYMEMAEKTAMETTVSNVTTAINLRYASLIMTGKAADEKRWRTENPFRLAEAFPPNYRGTMGAEQRLEADRPSWVFDPLRAELVYLPRLHSHLAADEVRFRLKRHPSGFGFLLAPSPPYDWRLEGRAENSQIACKRCPTSLFS